MEAKLIVVGGKANKSQVTLKPPATIGRSREASLTIAHPMVSRQHCEIVEADGMLRIRDLGSLNGTFIGNRQIIEAPLRPNDEFTVGPLTFRVSYEYPGEVTATGAGGPPVQKAGAARAAVPQGHPPGPPSAPPPSAAPISMSTLFPEGAPVPDFAGWESAKSRQAGEQPAPEPINLTPVDLTPIDLEPVDLTPVDLEPVDLEPVDLEPVDLEPIGLEPIDSPSEPMSFAESSLVAPGESAAVPEFPWQGWPPATAYPAQVIPSPQLNQQETPQPVPPGAPLRTTGAASAKRPHEDSIDPALEEYYRGIQ
jgi:predicted component of type VI protein secretion system